MDDGVQEPRQDRRSFLARMLTGAGALAVGGVVWGGFVQETMSNPLLLRPPAAVDESEFLRRCIRCGLCVEACPYDTLELGTPGDGRPLGMPAFTPRQIPCYLCENLPCVAACPTGALACGAVTSTTDAGEAFLDYRKVRIGVAIVDMENCVAAWGIQCDACYRVCPLLDQAITLDYVRNQRTGMHARLLPVIHADICTGCGLCERACITEKSAVVILPRDVALGKVGTNYIKGWEAEDEQRLQGAEAQTQTDRSSRSALEYLNEVEDDAR